MVNRVPSAESLTTYLHNQTTLLYPVQLPRRAASSLSTQGENVYTLTLYLLPYAKDGRSSLLRNAGVYLLNYGVVVQKTDCMFFNLKLKCLSL